MAHFDRDYAPILSIHGATISANHGMVIGHYVDGSGDILVEPR